MLHLQSSGSNWEGYLLYRFGSIYRGGGDSVIATWYTSGRCGPVPFTVYGLSRAVNKTRFDLHPDRQGTMCGGARCAGFEAFIRVMLLLLV